MERKKIVLFLFVFISFVSFLFSEENIGQINYIYLLKNSFVMMALLIVSIILFAVILDRFFYLRKIKCNSEKLIRKVEDLVKDNNYDAVLDIWNKKKNVLKKVIKLVVENREKNREDIDELYEILRSREKAKMEQRMVLLGIGASISPLLGLLGTVTGIMTAFSSLAVSSTGGPSVIAAGVSEALVTTAFGLIIGIPILFVYNIFSEKIRNFLNDMDVNYRMLVFLLKK